MSIDIDHLSLLSGIDLRDSEKQALRQDVENIVAYIEQLDELDTSGVEPTYQVTGLKNVWRDDAVDDGGVKSQDLVALAAEHTDNQIKVPKVL